MNTAESQYEGISIPQGFAPTKVEGEDTIDDGILEYDNIEKDLYPYTNVTLSQAERLAERVSVGDYTSSLMFGIQWDLTLKFTEEKAVKKSKDPTSTRTEYRNMYLGWSGYTQIILEIMLLLVLI